MYTHVQCIDAMQVQRVVLSLDMEFPAMKYRLGMQQKMGLEWEQLWSVWELLYKTHMYNWYFQFSLGFEVCLDVIFAGLWEIADARDVDLNGIQSLVPACNTIENYTLNISQNHIHHTTMNQEYHKTIYYIMKPRSDIQLHVSLVYQRAQHGTITLAKIQAAQVEIFSPYWLILVE